MIKLFLLSDIKVPLSRTIPNVKRHYMESLMVLKLKNISNDGVYQRKYQAYSDRRNQDPDKVLNQVRDLKALENEKKGSVKPRLLDV